MSDPTTILANFGRYAEMIRATIASPATMAPTVETADAIQVERGVVYPIALLDPRSRELSAADRLIELSSSPRLAQLAILDRGGHHRPVYTGLLVYSCLAAFRLVYETLSREDFGRWEEGLRPWCDLLEGELTQIDWPRGGMPASRGASAAEAAWMALALHTAGKVYIRDAWTDLAADTFGKLTRGQQPSGQFLQSTGADGPETSAYDELVLLHAAASYAVQSEDRPVAAAVARNAEFHLAETQPDHATAQPWAVFAFIWNPATRALADQILHATTVQHPAEPDIVSRMLLADALYCLRLFVK